MLAHIRLMRCDAMRCKHQFARIRSLGTADSDPLQLAVQDCIVGLESGVRTCRMTSPKRTCWREVASQPFPSANVTVEVAQCGRGLRA
jgi:hypothetical protein